MDLFQATQKEYVSPIDLTTLNTTYTTLEQGHQDAVKAKSQLQEAIANLDLNPEEDQFRANLLNQLRQTVADNTVFGNEYGALDDIVRMSGDIISSPEVLGRLRAQTNYKAFVDDVNTRTDLPEDYKQYFLNYSDANGTNKYHYEDKYDNNGNIIGGSEWKPVIRPTAVIDLEKALESAVKLAAADVTSINNIQYYDANDEHATYGSGYYYTTENGSIEKLSEDKIRKALNSVIESTPGLKESLRQDYDVTKWYYDNLSETERLDRNNKYVADYTNSDGSVLSFDDYLEKRTKRGIEAASYERDHINKDVHQISQNQNTVGSTLSGINDYNPGKLRAEGSPGTPVVSPINYGNQVMTGLQNTFDKLNELTNRYWGHKLENGNDKPIFNLLENITFDNMLNSSVFKNLTEEQQLEYRNLIDEYNQWKDNYNALGNMLSGDDKDAFNFITSVYAGKVDTNTKQGKKIVSHINDIRKYKDSTGKNYIGENIYINLSKLSEKESSALEQYFIDNDYYITQENGNKLLKIKGINIDDFIMASLLTNGTIEHNILLYNKNDKTFVESNNNKVKYKGSQVTGTSITGATVSTPPAMRYYDTTTFDIIKSAKLGIENYVIENPQFQNRNIGYRTWTEQYNVTTDSMYGKSKSELYQYLENSYIDDLKNMDITQVKVFGNVDDSRYFRELTVNQRNNIKDSFTAAALKGNIGVSACIVDGIGIGCNMTWADKDDNLHTIFVQDYGNNTLIKEINDSPAIQDDIKLGQLAYTHETVTYVGASVGCSSLGVQKIQGLGDGWYKYYCGSNEYIIDRDHATDLLSAFHYLHSMYQLKSKIANYDESELDKTKTLIDNISTIISNCSDKENDVIKQQIYIDLGIK